jgi:hypothetical protein
MANKLTTQLEQDTRTQQHWSHFVDRRQRHTEKKRSKAHQPVAGRALGAAAVDAPEEKVAVGDIAVVIAPPLLPQERLPRTPMSRIHPFPKAKCNMNEGDLRSGGYAYIPFGAEGRRGACGGEGGGGG